MLTNLVSEESDCSKMFGYSSILGNVYRFYGYYYCYYNYYLL